jgi:hypothetical protein
VSPQRVSRACQGRFDIDDWCTFPSPVPVPQKPRLVSCSTDYFDYSYFPAPSTLFDVVCHVRVMATKWTILPHNYFVEQLHHGDYGHATGQSDIDSNHLYAMFFHFVVGALRVV